MALFSERSRAAAEEYSVVTSFYNSYVEDVEKGTVSADFTFGNPHEMPLAGLVAALRKNIEPQTPDWFAYKTNVAEPRQALAEALSAELGLAFAPEDISMTQGAFGAISLAFSLVPDPGDEVLIPVPGWFCYGAMLKLKNLVPVKVSLAPEDFDLDLAAIEAAITPRTRMVVVNTPHNPTGRIYSPERLGQLADLLDRKSAEIGARIFILSDEPYRRIRFDRRPFHSPAQYYPWTLIDYSYGKVLLAPGLRLGYLALGPGMPEAERVPLRDLMVSTQMAMTWSFPDAPLQYSVPDLETVSIDIAGLQAKRDRLLGALRQWGYDIIEPEGTFYLWGRAPGDDSLAFAAALAARGVRVMPGTLFERPAHFRICLTATADMIETALPAFRDQAPR